MPHEGTPALSLKRVLLLWIVLTLAILAAMALIRVTEREASQYQASTFEANAREALDAGSFGKALRICSGALKIELGKADFWGLAHLLKANAYAGLGERSEALSELKTCVNLWTKAYYYATDQGRIEAEALGLELGLDFLVTGDLKSALDAFSVAGVGGGRPVEFLYELAETLTDEEKSGLWPHEPYLIVEDFGSATGQPFSRWVEEQGRELLANRFDYDVSRTDGASALLHVGPSALDDGRSLYSVPVYLPLSPKRYALRVLVKQEHSAELAIVLYYHFEAADTGAATSHADAKVLSGNWRRFDIDRDFYTERLAWANKQGYSIVGGVIIKLGLALNPGPENRYWLDRVELYLPPPEGSPD